MGDTDNGGGPNRSIRRARLLVLLIPLVIAVVAGGIALVNSNIFQTFEPSTSAGIAQNSATTEAALARDIEREARVLDVIEIIIVDGDAYFWIVDLDSGTEWSERDSKAVTRAFDVLFEWAQSKNYGVVITFFTIVPLMGADGVPVDVLQGAINIVCPADLVAVYGGVGANSDNILTQCEVSPNGLFISANAEVPLIGR